MCVVSMIFDHYEPLIPKPIIPFAPPSTIPEIPQPLFWPQIDLNELRKLIDEFKECLEAAKKVDKLTKQPDCEDPEKAKLLDRIAELEKLLAEK